MRRREAPGAARVVGVVLVLAWLAGFLPGLLLAAPPAPAAPSAPGPAEPHALATSIWIYLPLGLKGQVMDQLPPAPTAPATALPSPEASPTTAPPEPSATPSEAPPEPSPTATEQPTELPEPSATPTAAKPGRIHGMLVRNGVPLVAGMGADIGPGLVLRRCRDERTCEIVTRTGVLDDVPGAYAFEGAPSLEPGTYYQVTWINESADSGSPYIGYDEWLGSWYSPPIRDYTAGDDVDMGTYELADLELTMPTHGTGFGGFPIEFGWNRRSNETGRYHWSLCECCQNLNQRLGAYRTNSLGQRTRYTLNAAPPGFQIGIEYKYCWFLRIETDEHGYGESYHVRMLWFFFQALQPFADLDPADWPLFLHSR